MSVSLEEITAVVLAGGLGTRIRHVLPGLPKPMAPVAEKPFIEWVVRYLQQQGVSRVLVSTGYLGEKISGHFASTKIRGVSVTCIAEPEPLGTAGGFLHTSHQSGETPTGWLVLNGDSLILTDLSKITKVLNDSKADAAMLGLEVPDASRYGTLDAGSSGDLLRFAEKKPGAATINAGVYLFRGSLLAHFPADRPLSFEQQAFPALLARGTRIQVVKVNAPFLDIGTEESLKQAEGFILHNQEYFERSGIFASE